MYQINYAVIRSKNPFPARLAELICIPQGTGRRAQGACQYGTNPPLKPLVEDSQLCRKFKSFGPRLSLGKDGWPLIGNEAIDY